MNTATATLPSQSSYFFYSREALRRFGPPSGTPESFFQKTCRVAQAVFLLLASVLGDLLLFPVNLVRNLCCSSATNRSNPIVPVPQPNLLLPPPLLNGTDLDFIKDALEQALRRYPAEQASAIYSHLQKKEELLDPPLKQWIGACIIIRYLLNNPFLFQDPSHPERNNDSRFLNAPPTIKDWMRRPDIRNIESRFDSLSRSEKGAIMIAAQVPEPNQPPLSPHLQTLVEQIRQHGSLLWHSTSLSTLYRAFTPASQPPPSERLTPHRLLQDPLLNGPIQELLQIPPIKGITSDSVAFLRDALTQAIRRYPPEQAASICSRINKKADPLDVEFKQWIGACIIIRYLLNRKYIFLNPSDVETSYSTQNRNTPYFIVASLPSNTTEEIQTAFLALPLREQAAVVLAVQVPMLNEQPLPPPLQTIVDTIRGNGARLWDSPSSIPHIYSILVAKKF